MMGARTAKDATPVTRLEVGLGDRAYPIDIGAGLLRQAGALLAERLQGKQILIVTNAAVNALWGEPLRCSLAEAGFSVTTKEIPDGEAHKRIETVAALYDACVEARLHRTSAVVALGGGIVGDVAGFLAATYMRGIDFIQVPTTLLSQVDSSVGGKVGVNHREGKNLIGAFYQPKRVIIDTDTLSTLPDREVRAGYGEVIKTALLGDGDLFAFLETSGSDVLRLDAGALRHVVAACCRTKAAVVEQDEREAGLRAILNLGHTFGHALETLTSYQTYRHGEAVAVGLIAACRLAASVLGLPDKVTARVARLVEAAGLPTWFPPFPADAWRKALALDKKNRDDAVTFVLPEGIGQCRVLADVPLTEALAVIEAMTKGRTK
ncbi:3-dehydroquinate synthase [Heliomicrobium modesticaldum Ice1]|uniref:3-dehydroquinate synthase n=1 Tax=Heliobacterium modesticaldum (strain ATCC 51547 / Ice1) TaxID=498761 RepID=B0TEE8_HELMI|nr:3-dehydroquinate synthase [Heliomicrobium modesticaldum]ABZ82867.1 3-dehydroquinate synthase [Heliomicrobium modesticaldum Ice1]